MCEKITTLNDDAIKGQLGDQVRQNVEEALVKIYLEALGPLGGIHHGSKCFQTNSLMRASNI